MPCIGRTISLKIKATECLSQHDGMLSQVVRRCWMCHVCALSASFQFVSRGWAIPSVSLVVLVSTKTHGESRRLASAAAGIRSFSYSVSKHCPTRLLNAHLFLPLPHTHHPVMYERTTPTYVIRAVASNKSSYLKGENGVLCVFFLIMIMVQVSLCGSVFCCS